MCKPGTVPIGETVDIEDDPDDRVLCDITYDALPGALGAWGIEVVADLPVGPVDPAVAGGAVVQRDERVSFRRRNVRPNRARRQKGHNRQYRENQSGTNS